MGERRAPGMFKHSARFAARLAATRKSQIEPLWRAARAGDFLMVTERGAGRHSLRRRVELARQFRLGPTILNQSERWEPH
jgi:hypothetical protein